MTDAGNVIELGVDNRTRVTLRDVREAFMVFIDTLGQWVHDHWNALTWPIDAAFGATLAILAFQITWRFVWSAVLDERWWQPEITFFVVKPLISALLGVGWLCLVLAREVPVINRGVFGLTGILSYDWQRRHRPGTPAGYLKTIALAILTAVAVRHEGMPLTSISRLAYLAVVHWMNHG